VRRRGLLSAVLLLVLVGVGQGSSGAQSQDPAATQALLEGAKAFKPYRPHWGGENAAGMKLDSIYRGNRASGDWSFFYGECVPYPDGEGGTICSPPVEVQNWNICKRWPKEQWRLMKLRGARAIWRWAIGGLEVYTGRTTIVIFAAGRRVALNVAAALRSVRASGPVGRLTPPARGALHGDLGCQQKEPNPIP
jgi:hypothetical protein